MPSLLVVVVVVVVVVAAAVGVDSWSCYCLVQLLKPLLQ